MEKYRRKANQQPTGLMMSSYNHDYRNFYKFWMLLKNRFLRAMEEALGKTQAHIDRVGQANEEIVETPYLLGSISESSSSSSSENIGVAFPADLLKELGPAKPEKPPKKKKEKKKKKKK
eukprot:Platyproteum_vivax@DN7058_c0_g1_i4.p1